MLPQSTTQDVVIDFRLSSMIEHLRHPLVASAEHRSEEVEVGNGLPLPTTASWPLISNNLRMFLERRASRQGASIRSPDEGVNRELRRLPGGMDPDDGD